MPSSFSVLGTHTIGTAAGADEPEEGTTWLVTAQLQRAREVHVDSLDTPCISSPPLATRSPLAFLGEKHPHSSRPLVKDRLHLALPASACSRSAWGRTPLVERGEGLPRILPARRMPDRSRGNPTGARIPTEGSPSILQGTPSRARPLEPAPPAPRRRPCLAHRRADEAIKHPWGPRGEVEALAKAIGYERLPSAR